MEQGEKLKVFFNLLQRGMDQQKAFEEAFGNIEEVDKGYLRYINPRAFPYGRGSLRGDKQRLHNPLGGNLAHASRSR